ncbi:MAG: hypothetical protein ACI4KR_00245 [Ruminiclostridium sp.]
MNKSYSVGDLISLYYENEFAAVEEAELPFFSAKHKRKMQRIFNLFESNKARMNSPQLIFSAPSQLSLKKRLIFNVIIIVGLAFMAGCANALISKSLPGTAYSDFMNIFGYNMHASEGYLHFTTQIGDKRVITAVKDDDNIELIFPKSGYTSKINTDVPNTEQTEISEFSPICIEFGVEDLSDFLDV